MWVDMQKKYLTSQTVKYKGKQIPITEAIAIKADLPLKERRALHKEIVTKFTVTEAYDSRKLERFGTVRREGDVVIIESGYSVNGSDGREHLDYSGVLPLSSAKYIELNKILNGFAK